jgi:hypothetical protein
VNPFRIPVPAHIVSDEGKRGKHKTDPNRAMSRRMALEAGS